MDFSLTEEQRETANLAARIFTDRCTLERLKAVEASVDRYDRELWSECAKAGLIGAALPEDVDGSGGGFLDICLLLEQQGRRVAPIPLLPTVVSGAMPLARFGSTEQRQRYLSKVAGGSSLLTAALEEAGTHSRAPMTTARREGKFWRLNGVKLGVPVADAAAAVLVPARTSEGQIGIFIVERETAGLTTARQDTMNWEAQCRLELSNVMVSPDAVLGSLAAGAEILDWIVDRTTVGLCAIASGVCQEAVRLTAEYASNRKQFDKPIAMFQAVGQRMADSYIDNEAVNLTMLQAASRLAENMPSPKEIATAKFWAADGGNRIAHAALHIHGGISIDVDYPVHRYFLWLKQIECTLGAATPHLVRLGEMLAAEPA